MTEHAAPECITIRMPVPFGLDADTPVFNNLLQQHQFRIVDSNALGAEGAKGRKLISKVIV